MRRYDISCVRFSTIILENSRMWVGCWPHFEPHLCQKPAFNSPLDDSQSIARQGSSFHCHGVLGLALASVDRENPGASKRGITHGLHPRNCHRDSLPWGSGLRQSKPCESIVIKVFKISASVIVLKKHNLSEAKTMTLVFTKTKWPQSLSLAGVTWEGEGGERKPEAGQEMLSALRKFWQVAFYG